MKGFRAFPLYVFSVFLCFPGKAQQRDTKDQLAQLTATVASIFLNNPDSALRLNKKALALALQSEDEYYKGYCYYLFSKAYWVKANYRLSMEYGFKALKFFENSPHKKQWISSLLSVARTLVELGNHAKAGELIRKAIQISEEESDQEMLAAAYREHSYLLTETGELDSALLFADRGIALYEALGDSLDASILYSRKSRIYFIKGDFPKSRDFAYKGLLLDTLVGNRRALAISYYQAAQNEYALKNIKEAERLLRHSIRVNHEIGNLTSLVRAHELLASVYLTTQRHALGARQLQLASQYKDSLYNSEKSGQIQEMQSLYELEGKENTIRILEQDNVLHLQEVKNQQLFLAFLLVGVLLLVVVIFFLSRLRNIQNRTNSDLAHKNLTMEQQQEELQAQAEKLQQLNNLQTKLFSVISHDLRGPISNLQSLLELFTKNLMTAEEFLMISDKLKNNLNVTQRTLENLLNWALAQMDGIKTEKKNIDIHSCIEETCRLMEEMAIRKSVSLQRSLNDVLVVHADPDQVQLVLRNLIHNGIKFSKIGDTITITTSRKNGHCHVLISDSGIGMSQEEMNTIVESKEHFTKRGTQQEKGTGLGLLLCKEFIERNDGTLSIKSRSGEGTEVSFTLKLA